MTNGCILRMLTVNLTCGCIFTILHDYTQWGFGLTCQMVCVVQKMLTALVWKILCEHANLLQCPQSFKTHLSNCWLCLLLLLLLLTIWDPPLKCDSVVTSYPWLFWPADFLQTFSHLLTRVWKCSNSRGSHSLMFYPLFKCRLFYSVCDTKSLFFFLSLSQWRCFVKSSISATFCLLKRFAFCL